MTLDNIEDGKPEPSQQPDAAAPAPSGGHQPQRRRRLLVAGLGVLVPGAALWFAIPWVAFTLNVESTEDAFVNDHVTFVAARVRGQVSRVLVDDNNRVHTNQGVGSHQRRSTLRPAQAVHVASDLPEQACSQSEPVPGVRQHKEERQTCREWQHPVSCSAKVSLMRVAIPCSARQRERVNHLA